MSKRKRFVITSLLLSVGFVGIQFVDETYRFVSIGGLGIFSLIIFFWALREGLGLNMTLLSLILPFLFTVGVGLFWFLLPAGVLTRIPIVILFGLGIYGLCLTMNIYTVSTIRTIALQRAAKGVGFVLTLLTFFLIFDTILSFRWPVYYSFPGVFLISVLLFFQGFWGVVLEKSFSTEILKYSLIGSLAITQISIIMFFWPVTVVVGSLFLTTAAYALLGLGQAKLEDRLFSQTTRDYLMVAVLVFIIMFFATRWG